MINGHRQKITHGIATTAVIEKNFPKTICVTDTGDVKRSSSEKLLIVKSGTVSTNTMAEALNV